MLLEGSSDLIKSVSSNSRNNCHIELLCFFDDRVLVISKDGLALYKDESYINDPLGNGLISFATIPDHAQFNDKDIPWVTHTRAGFVGLRDGKALVILPNCVKLYSDNHDALKNTQALTELALE